MLETTGSLRANFTRQPDKIQRVSINLMMINLTTHACQCPSSLNLVSQQAAFQLFLTGPNKLQKGNQVPW
jgi:hypothetical protein